MSSRSLLQVAAGLRVRQKVTLAMFVSLIAVCVVFFILAAIVRWDFWYIHAATFLFSGGAFVFNALTLLEQNR